MSDLTVSGSYGCDGTYVDQGAGVWYCSSVSKYLFDYGMVWMIASAPYPPPEYYSDDHQSTPWDSSWVSAGITVAEVSGPPTYSISGNVTDPANGNVGVAGVLLTASATGQDDVTDTTSAPGTNVAPENMTSNSAPSPYEAAASSAVAGQAWNCFDGDATTDWLGNDPGWVTIKVAKRDVIVTYKVGMYNGTFPFNANRAPKDWKLQGSNDGGSTWDDLDTVTGETSWTKGEEREYTCDTQTTAYGLFRFLISDNNGDTYDSIASLKLYGAGGRYLLAGLVDATWRVTPTKTGETFDSVNNPGYGYEDVAVSGADETGVDFELVTESGGMESTASGQLGAQGTAATLLSLTAAAAGRIGALGLAQTAMGSTLPTAAATQVGATAEAQTLLTLRSAATAQVAVTAAAETGLVTDYHFYLPSPRIGPAWRQVVDVRGLNRVTCATYHDGAYWVGAVRTGGSDAVLYRVDDGVVQAVTIPDGALVEAVTSLASDGIRLHVAGAFVASASARLGGEGGTPRSFRLDSYDGSAWTTTWDPAAYALGVEEAGVDKLLWAGGTLWGAGLQTYGSGTWHGGLKDRVMRRLRPAGPGALCENAGDVTIQRSPLSLFRLPLYTTPNTVCWYLGRPWCLRYVASSQLQALCYGDPATGTWQDVARWPVETSGCYWYMRPWHGQLLLYGATMTLTQAAPNVWLADLSPVRGQWTPPVLSLAQAESEFTQSLTEDDPALALRAATAPRLVVLYPPLTTAYAGEVLYVEPEWAEAGGTIIPRWAALQAVVQEIQQWGGTGWGYAAETPLLTITSIAEESALPMLLALYQEWPDGTGTEAPALLALRQEYPAEENPLLLGVYQEWPDGTGTEAPALLGLRQDWSDGSGDSPELLALQQTWPAPSPGPELIGIHQAWPSGFRGPAEGEDILVLEPFRPSLEPVNAVRVVVPFEAVGHIRACLIRIDSGQDVEDWASYQVFPPMADVLLETPGAVGDAYRVVLVGRGEVPDVTVVCNPD